MIQLLDCTLREGLQITNLEHETSINTLQGLAKSKIDFVEAGLLDKLSGIEETEKLSLSAGKNSTPVIFANFHRCDFANLPVYKQGLPEGIRVGFKINDFRQTQQELQNTLLHIKSLGYKVFMQPCHTLSYTEDEFTELINFANALSPYSFAIVDSYGSMFEDDLMRYVKLTNEYLDKHIKLNFHSHNNLQLSLALTIFILNNSGHDIIIDSSLYGLGRGGGNLNTELIAAYLNRKFNKNYDLETIFSTIEKNILPLQQNINWGYSLKTLEYGLKDIHP